MLRQCSAILGLLASFTLFACSSSDSGAKGSPANGVDGGDGSGGGGNGGGSNGGAGARDPFKATGEPLTAEDGKWTYIEFPDTACRDGSKAGIEVRLNSASDKLMIYLEGGGACFDAFTCSANPTTVVGMGKNAAGDAIDHKAGIFNSDNDKNPVKDWNWIYVPYCTGDIHGGTNDNGTVDGVTGTQHFVGRKNIEAFAQRMVPSFSKLSQILLTGISAGGFGAASNADYLGWAFDKFKAQVSLIDDSGPSMSAKYLPACLQSKWRDLWGFRDSILKDCGSSCPKDDDYTLDFTKFLIETHPDQSGGLIETQDDAIITGFFGYGQNDCTGTFTTPIPAATYKEALLDTRSQLSSYKKFYTYYPVGTQHTWLAGDSFYTEAEGGSSLVDWATAIINDKPASHVGATN